MALDPASTQPLSPTTDDLPFYNHEPYPIVPLGWAIIIAATIVGSILLTVSPMADLQGVASLVPAILFAVVPLIALALVSHGHLNTLFRPYGLAALGRSVFFAVTTMILSSATALALQFFMTFAVNPVIDVLAVAGPFDIALFMLRTFIQLIGEEVVTILPLLAVMWTCYTKFGWGRRASLAAGILVSTVWFCSLHLPTYDWNLIQCFVVIGISRLVLTWSYIRTRNLWVSAGAHIINDWSLFAISFAGSHMPIGT
ncbi:CPBP family intramembrane glutamic endopeptidase [Rhizobium sp. PL01]|uniref:CPBP family intramembrane glutamic endopeptidase n=1 Tax=Rhizobium sp. PL01 TaxID=3085631 RepID=UPI0029811E23|nr:CPBP family intramembrane glutamic endopeptidase [Rhizobium sp. PL01]MDW5318539.1 CPBP family intramembrane glutamic endopeptidase [Rhizobium sp. PL01]